MPYERTPSHRSGCAPSTRPTVLAGDDTAHTTAAVATDSRTSPPRYRNGEYCVVRQISRPMMTSPAKPVPSRRRRRRTVTSAAIARLGLANASPAPISSANARVSVPS